MRLLIVVLKEVTVIAHRNVTAYLIILAFSKINKLINEIKKYLPFVLR